MAYNVIYQDDLETPGISPRNARPRKHMRHRPNLRKNARGRPQILQRLCLRVENLGFLASLTRFAVVAKSAPRCHFELKLRRHAAHARNGIPICFSNARA